MDQIRVDQGKFLLFEGQDLAARVDPVGSLDDVDHFHIFMMMEIPHVLPIDGAGHHLVEEAEHGPAVIRPHPHPEDLEGMGIAPCLFRTVGSHVFIQQDRCEFRGRQAARFKLFGEF